LGIEIKLDHQLFRGMKITVSIIPPTNQNKGFSIKLRNSFPHKPSMIPSRPNRRPRPKIPADINKKIYDQSKDWAMLIAEELKYIGTLCVEFFIDRNDNLYVNEIAPRVHNSGHLTINAYNISQFENHVRAVCQLEQIPVKKISNAKMINLIGDQISHYRKVSKFNDNEFFFDYLKKEIKEKRKMGHFTTLV